MNKKIKRRNVLYQRAICRTFGSQCFVYGRGKIGISVKMLVKICNLLGLCAYYVLFGDSLYAEKLLFNKIKRIDRKYIPLLNSFIKELLILDK